MHERHFSTKSQSKQPHDVELLVDNMWFFYSLKKTLSTKGGLRERLASVRISKPLINFGNFCDAHFHRSIWVIAGAAMFSAPTVKLNNNHEREVTQ